MVAVSGTSCSTASHLSTNFRLIDKAGRMQTIAAEAEAINQAVNDYLLAHIDETKRIKFIHVSSIIHNGLMDLDVTGLDEIPTSISSSMPLFNKACRDLGMESLSDFIESLHLDIEAMFKIVTDNNRGI